ncbi:hypothetical protein FEM48_Zijuj04G0063100 [Ziziphus jujuba var. spinosa]|uniref:At1g61320/AtMIF1 LRR domain-containing protein n=1 Tax=Ziziphus jujuba var. spinosa TaxID=714518 RepID=A0A978VIA2_ZIZJJ|nr:hypothetical protein FEM48_Zijuj04G0063100 [Ziziphus jujuba var. spinosa]
MEEEKTDMDMISELPEAKIVTIMSLLTMEDATRFNLASKKFFSALKISTPILDFDFSSFKKNSRKFCNQKSFLDFVDKSLEFLSNSNDTNCCCCCFERLSFSGPISNILVSKICQFSLHNKIKELDLDGNFSSCTLPKALFSSQHLTRLKIYGFDLGLGGDRSSLVLDCPLVEDINLSCCWGLKSITLCEIKHSVFVTDEWFQDHVSGLNLLETLKLDYCPRLKNICISSDHNNLKTLVLDNCGELESINITVPKLEYLEFDLEDCALNISSSSKYLKNLIMRSAHLTSLKLLECYNLSKLEIEVPNIVAFTYSGDLPSSPPLHNKAAVKEENVSCCASPHIKCWRHFFVEVEMDNFDDSYERSSLQHLLVQNAKGLTITNTICNT